MPDQVYNAAEGAPTSGNMFVVLISNPTRTSGYFNDAHHRNRDDWQCFAFDAEESPLVDRQFVRRMEDRHGRESDEFGIRVAGRFPGEDTMDDTGYPLISETRISVVPRTPGGTTFMGRKILGVDPSGDGDDVAAFVLRDRFHAECIATLKTTNPRQIAERVLSFLDFYDLEPEDVVVDSFGVGADVGKEVALASDGKCRVYTPLVGNRPADEEKYNGIFFRRRDDELKPDGSRDLFLNLRALIYFRARKWLIEGGALVDESVEKSSFVRELLHIKYKRSIHGSVIQLMSKKETRKLRIPSPNKADAFALTFLRDIEILSREEEDLVVHQ